MAAILVEWIVRMMEKLKVKAVEKAEMVTASWQPCKAKPVSRNSPDSDFGPVSAHTVHLVVGVTIVAPGMSVEHWDSTALAARVDFDTFCRNVAQGGSEVKSAGIIID